MKKLMLGSAAGLLALLLVAALVAGRSIDAMAKRGVEAGTRYATGVETRLDSIRIGLFRGEANLTQLRLANPEGFSDQPFLDLAEGHVAVTIGSLRRSEVELPRLILNDAHLRLERNAAGQTNYDAILEQLGRLSRADAPRTRTAGGT